MNTRGYTLPELLSAFVVTLAGLGLGLVVVGVAAGTLAEVNDREKLAAEATVALERMAKDTSKGSWSSQYNTLAVTRTGATLATYWKIVDDKLLHGSYEELLEASEAKLAAKNATGLEVGEVEDGVRFAMTLQGSGKKFTVEKISRAWAKTIP